LLWIISAEQQKNHGQQIIISIYQSPLSLIAPLFLLLFTSIEYFSICVSSDIMSAPRMKDLDSMSLLDTLYRMAEIYNLKYIPSNRTRRACVAFIFRLAHDSSPVSKNAQCLHHQQPGTTAQRAKLPPNYSNPPLPTSHAQIVDGIYHLSKQPWFQSNENSLRVELLFMQRAKNPKDRWSGQMALPGGRQTGQETDQQTVVREVYEEIGLDLTNNNQFLYLGRMSDRPIDAFRKVKPMCVCPFIYLQLTEITPEFHLQLSEVNAVIWSPLNFFTNARLSWNFLVHPLMIQYTSRISRKRKIDISYVVKKQSPATSAMLQSMLIQTEADAKASAEISKSKLHLPHILPPILPNLFNLPSVQFPALALPGQFIEASGRFGVSKDEKTHYSGDFPAEECSFILWGFTLSMLSDFLRLFHCNTLHEHLEKGKNERARTLKLLHKAIEMQESMQQTKVKVNEFATEWKEHGLKEAIKHAREKKHEIHPGKSKTIVHLPAAPLAATIEGKGNETVIKQHYQVEGSNKLLDNNSNVEIVMDEKLAEAMNESSAGGEEDQLMVDRVDMSVDTVEKQRNFLKSRVTHPNPNHANQAQQRSRL
jgi:8-oxo-dGTP pyrophosphatase MutT (NUDIX family)